MEQINIYSGSKIISKVFVQDGIEGLEKCLDSYQHVFAVMDENVAMHSPYAMQIAQIMNSRHVPGKLVAVSEETKTMDTVMDICEWLLDSGADRNALVLAIGGGITTDIVGFAASIYKRGVRFAYMPTTLLAQVDAGIGGKTGVNLDRYKNILGVIRQPEFVYLCPQVLSSLPHKEFIAGAAELLKTFIIEDKGYYDRTVAVLNDMQKGYAILPDESSDDYWGDCIQAYSQELTELIAAAARVKAGIVSRDQFEKGERRKLNLGHTFAHAIETLAQRSGYEISHGEAVAMGLVLAARLSDRVFHGDMDSPTALEAEVRANLVECGLNPDCPFNLEDMAEIMLKDKKAETGKIHFVLMREIGDVTVYDLTVEEVCRLMA